MQRKMWKRALAIVVAGSVLQFGSCLSWWGQALIFGSGWTVGETITNELGIAGLITDLVPDGE